MPVSPERKHLADELRRLAAGETDEEVAAALRRRADLIEADGDGSGGSDLDASHNRTPSDLA